MISEDRPEAARLFTSLQQSFLNLRRGAPGRLPPPVESMDGLWSETEQAGVAHAFREAIVGSPARVKQGITAFQSRTAADEIIVTAAIYDHGARLRSHEIVAKASDLTGAIVMADESK